MKVVLLLVSSLFAMILSTYSTPCTRRTDIKATQALRHIQSRYMFVRRATTSIIQPFNSSLLPGQRTTRSSDSAKIPGSSYCPWTWSEDEDPTRMPRNIVKAVCPGCAHYCRSVNYHHRVLVPRCDKVTGEKVWKWKEKTLAIAFVYDPY